jgi:hypothetical protein
MSSPKNPKNDQDPEQAPSSGKMEEDTQATQTSSTAHEDLSKAKEKAKDAFTQAATFAQANKTDTITYILLFVGIFTYFFSHLFGGLLIGGIAGVNFFRPIMELSLGLNEFIKHQGIIRSLIAGSVLVCLVLAAPFLFLGLGITTIAMSVIIKP